MRFGIKYLFFFLGLGSQLQVIASLSMTEMFVFAVAPILCAGEYPYMRRSGVATFWWLSMCVVFGGMISSFANHTALSFVVRGMATACLLPCSIVVCHWLLRKDMNAFKWLLIGIALSGALCTFVFHRATEALQAAGNAGGISYEAVTAADIASGPLFWITRLGSFIQLPAKGWYLKCPFFYSVGAPLFLACFSLLTSASGRSSALGSLGSVVMIVLGGKTRKSMRRVGNHFGVLAVIAIIGAFAAKEGYHIAASRGWMGEDSRKKYEKQTKGNRGMLALLMGGRMESFAGLLACVDKPIIGFGPWPFDEKGYTEEFLRRYGNAEDYVNYLNARSIAAMQGTPSHLIPGHSHLTGFWLVYGISGLVFWIYVLFVLLRFLKQDCWAVPQWYMWLACAIPAYFWNIFFSPFANRFPTMMFVVACLMARAVRRGVVRLPRQMELEIFMAERKGYR